MLTIKKTLIATLITLTILYFKKIYNDKKNVNSLSETSTNILQIQIDNKTVKSSDIIDRLKKNVNYLNLKSFASDNETEQFNFWFDAEKDHISSLISEIEKITLENKDIKIQRPYNGLSPNIVFKTIIGKKYIGENTLKEGSCINESLINLFK